MIREIAPRRAPATFKMWALTDGKYIGVFGDGTPVFAVNKGDMEDIREEEHEKIRRVYVTVRFSRKRNKRAEGKQ